MTVGALTLAALATLGALALAALVLLVRAWRSEQLLRDRLDDLQHANSQLVTQLAHAQAQRDAVLQANERVERQLAIAQQSLKDSFANLAQSVLDDKAARFTVQNARHLDQVLGPLKERIDAFQRRVEESYSNESRERFAMKHELERLLAMNTQLSQDARNLADALKGQSQVQGAWGELILERLLESAGLERGREYDTQVSIDDDEQGRRRPDAILRLPEGRDLVVDAKVSLVAYERYCACNDERDAQAALKAHVASMRAHVAGLSERRYESLRGLNAPDFTLMFVPIEGAFAAVLRADDRLIDDAFRRKVLLVSPTTLLVVLKLVALLWRQERVDRDALAIVEQGRLVYEKLAGFIAEFDATGRQIRAAAERFDAARSRLTGGRGNLVSRVEKLVSMGVSPTQRLPADYVDAAADGDDAPGPLS